MYFQSPGFESCLCLKIISFLSNDSAVSVTKRSDVIGTVLSIVLGGVGIVACCLYLWSAFTKSGKKWIESL